MAASAIVGAVVVFASSMVGAPEAKPSASLASGGLDGSLGTGMQPVNLPSKVSRVAIVPGTDGAEAWAIGHMTLGDPSWGREQTVLLHYRRGEGWSVYGPPRDSSGTIVEDLTLSTMSFAPGGEGWAVGAGGAMVRYRPGGGWTYEPACGPGGLLSGSCTSLFGVSVVSDGGRIVGYAVGSSRESGSANTILRYDGSSWTVDSAIVVADPNPVIDFVAVATVNANEAWAIGGTSSRELQVFRRIGAVWQRQRTHKPIFDNPMPSNDGRVVNLSAQGSAVAASVRGSTTTLWVGGGIYPVDPGEPVSQSDVPFTLRWTSTGGWVSFCPPQYSLHNDSASVIDVCDRRMPMSPYDISSLSLLANGELFAGGLGLFHYKDDVWWREPNSNAYLSSVSFASTSEGWVASSGGKIGGWGMASSNATALGHYTSAPDKSRTARWPHFNRNTLYGVALAPSGSEAIAVGANGMALLYRPGLGWDKAPGSAGSAVLKDVAWANPNQAWAVGETGVIARYDRGRFDVYSPGVLTRSNLNGIALSGGRGFAVGDRGTILTFSGGGWSKDPSDGRFGVHLYDVASMGPGFVAVGADATILVNPSGAPGGWSRDDSLSTLISSFPDTRRPTLLAVATTPSGAVAVGGASKFAAVRDPGQGFRPLSALNREGSILDLKVVSTARGVEAFAIVSDTDQRFRASATTLMHFDGSKWRDLDLSARRTTDTGTDIGGIPDPIFGLALEPSGRSGWAVGGIVPNVTDETGNYYSEQTSSIYRFDLAGDPKPPNVAAPARLPGTGFNFAYFSESSCGKGYCSIAVGSGTLADEVALAIRDQINEASKHPNGPKFVIFGGNMRAAGLPEELEQFRGYLSDFRIPVFAALGPKDLYRSTAGNQVRGFLPELPDDDFENAGLSPPDVGSAAGSNRFALRTFANEWAPWGTGAKTSPVIRPVDHIGLPPTSGLARTHYAFDYAPSGVSLARFVVLDTSDHLFSKQAQAANQNPPNQDQASWLSLVVSDARSNYNPPLPVVVVMNVPTMDPLRAVNQPLLADGKGFEAAAVGYGLSGVLTGYIRANASYAIPSSGQIGQVPIFVLGGGGAPPPKSASKYPNDGHYHSWALVNLDPKGVTLANPQARVTVRTVPVIESVALHAVEGLSVEGGWTLQFRGIARALTGGATPLDPDQKRMSYLQFPAAHRCFSGGLTPPGGFCLNQSALPPGYHFESENPDVADFVKPSGIPRYPAVENGFLIPNDQLGFLCTFKAGTAWVKIVAGGKQMRMPVTVGPGFGPCVDKPILPVITEKIPRPVVARPEPIPERVVRPLLYHPSVPDPFVLALPPVPAPIPAPAPPASAAGARKEEEEAQYEEQGDDGESQAVMLSYERRSQSSDPLFGWMTFAAGAALGLLLAFASGTLVAIRRLPVPGTIYVDGRIE